MSNMIGRLHREQDRLRLKCLLLPKSSNGNEESYELRPEAKLDDSCKYLVKNESLFSEEIFKRQDRKESEEEYYYK